MLDRIRSTFPFLLTFLMEIRLRLFLIYLTSYIYYIVIIIVVEENNIEKRRLLFLMFTIYIYKRSKKQKE